MSTRVDAEVEFSVSVGDREVRGTLRGTGAHLTLSVDDPGLLGGVDAASARVLAARLAEQGLSLSILTQRRLVTLGLPRVPFWQRRITGSPHMRVESLAAARRLLRLRRAAREGTSLVPPGTPLPLAPTFLRRPRRPTTTHDPDRGGYPRLVLAPDEHPGPDETRTAFFLADRTVLGSHPACDIVLEGLQPRHAEIVRTEDDEFVVRSLNPGWDVRVHGAVVLREALLRTGTRVELGGWTLNYAREEYADHGRPYAGRVGGELGHQKPQPPREQLSSREP